MDIRIVFAFVFAAVAASGCNPLGGKGCTLIGCSDGFTAAVRSADGSIPSGAHRIEILADTTSLTCSFTYPLAQAGGGDVQPSCGADMRVTIFSETTPGKFYEEIALPGTPGQVHAWQYVDDVPILDVAAAPTYQASAPNGPECGPICIQASVSWTFM